MLSKNALWIIFISAAAGIAALIYTYSSQSLTFHASTNSSPVSMSKSSSLTPPTGNINDLAKEMAEELSNESLLITENENESDLINEEIKALDELGQSYNENEF
jgi:flagellar motility protein MotE (MotC chaperone)